jgi:transposase
LASNYRSRVRLHFPNARIVADRFHVIRLINHHFLAGWRDLDGPGSRNRGLIWLMRRHRHNLQPEQLTRLATYLAQHPPLEAIYRFKQRLCYLLLKKHRTRKQCLQLIPRFLRVLYRLSQAGEIGRVSTATRYQRVAWMSEPGINRLPHFALFWPFSCNERRQVGASPSK